MKSCLCLFWHVRLSAHLDTKSFYVLQADKVTGKTILAKDVSSVFVSQLAEYISVEENNFMAHNLQVKSCTSSVRTVYEENLKKFQNP